MVLATAATEYGALASRGASPLTDVVQALSSPGIETVAGVAAAVVVVALVTRHNGRRALLLLLAGGAWLAWKVLGD